MKGKKEQIDNGAKSFRSLGEIEEFFDKQAEFAKRELNFFLAVSNITHEEEEAFAAAPASYDDMTEEDWQKEHEARREMERQLKHEAKFANIRKFLEIGINLKKDDPYSELFKTSKELLDFVDRCESTPSSVNRYERKKFMTDLIRYKELLKGETALAETDAQKVKFGFHK